MPDIHPSSVIDPAAEIAETVKIGPFCTVGPDVTLADGVTLVSHVVVDGLTSIGGDTTVFPFASIGTRPQDLKFKGELTRLDIGERNMIREHVTMNPGTEGGGGVTAVGDGGLFMMGSHVAHDCQVGNNVILANNATLAGHVNVGDFAVLGGLCAVHQFSRIGHHVMIGGCSGVEGDIIPFGSVMGNRARLSGLNLIGLKRRGFDRDTIHNVRNAYKLLFGETGGTMAERLAEVSGQFADCEPVMDIVTFIQADSSRPLCQPQSSAGNDDG